MFRRDSWVEFTAIDPTRHLASTGDLQMSNARGMIQFDGATYRIAEVNAGTYQVFRVLDDASMGTFETPPVPWLEANGCVDALLSEIARAAFMQGMTR